MTQGSSRRSSCLCFRCQIPSCCAFQRFWNRGTITVRANVHFALNLPFTHSLLAQARCLSCKIPLANRFLSRLKSRLFVTTASRETRRRTARTGSTKCRDGCPRRRWRSFARFSPTTRPCCYASRWALAPIRRKRPFKAALLTRFSKGRASRFQWTLWRSTAAATLVTS